VVEACTASYFDQFHAVALEIIAAQGRIIGKVVNNSSSIISSLKPVIDIVNGNKGQYSSNGSQDKFNAQLNVAVASQQNAFSY